MPNTARSCKVAPRPVIVKADKLLKIQSATDQYFTNTSAIIVPRLAQSHKGKSTAHKMLQNTAVRLGSIDGNPYSATFQAIFAASSNVVLAAH